MAIADVSNDQDLQEVVAQETEQLQASPGSQHKHHWWYYLLVMFMFAVMIVSAGWFINMCYVGYTNWYNTALQQSFISGKAYGVATGVQQGRIAQKQDDEKTRSLALKIAKANATKTLNAAKIASYQLGAQNANNMMQKWWSMHCRYDSVIASYVCNSSP